MVWATTYPPYRSIGSFGEVRMPQTSRCKPGPGHRNDLDTACLGLGPRGAELRVGHLARNWEGRDAQDNKIR